MAGNRLIFSLFIMSMGSILSCFLISASIFGSGFHFMGAVFACLVILLLVLGKAMPRETPYVQEDAGLVDLTPWKYAKPVGIGLIVTVLLIYFLLRNG